MRSPWLLLLLTWIVLLPAAAPAAWQEPGTGTVRGVVSDKDFDAPLAGAKVAIIGTRFESETTQQGTYVLRQVPAGRYTLVFSKDGYVRKVRSDVVVAAGRLTEVDVALSGDFTDMEEFVVQDLLRLGGGSEAALLQLRFKSPALLDSVSSEIMGKAGASDAASALRLVAGATVKDGKSAVIRGLPDRYVSSQMNGVRLPTADEDKRAVELDQFPAAVIESIQVSKTFTPDQQGDASGGAVDVRLKGVPTEPLFLKFKMQSGYNDQVTGRTRFLSYDGGGVSGLGKDDGRRAIQYQNLGKDWDGAVGVQEENAPIDYKLQGSGGGRFELFDGVEFGGLGSMFYERDSSFYDNGKDDSWWVETPGAGMTPKSFQGTVQDGDFKTGLFDVTQGAQSVKWGGLGTMGLRSKNHSVSLLYLYTRNAVDKATLAEDTRGKQYYFPGYDPEDKTTPGHADQDAAPYLRLETLEYTERTTTTLQLHGQHELPFDRWGGAFRAPEIDWVVAWSTAGLDQPDKRQFGESWVPDRAAGSLTIPPTHRPYKPGANFTLGNLQRIWKEIEEESRQYAANLKLPFKQWTGDEGYVKVGLFHDRVDRTFMQESFSNFGDNSTFYGPWKQRWSSTFPFQDHPITESTFDVDYDADLTVSAWYAMLDIPIVSSLTLVGGARFERTRIGIQNFPEADATWYPPGATAPTKLNPGDADVDFSQDDVLPSIGLVFNPIPDITLRGSYNQTVARQTFKELTPIIQQEYLGGPIFIGNPDLGMSALQNWDVRLDYTPLEGSLLSVSWFRKYIKDPIEYVQRIVAFNYTTAVNYPRGELSGWEFELRQQLGQVWDPLAGLAIGANATLIDSSVTLPDDEAASFQQPNIQAPMFTRDMTNAPDHLYNLYLTYDVPVAHTQIGIFYNVQGDALIAGATESAGNYVPNVYAKEFDTLNLSVTQGIGEHFSIRFQAKNLTNPEIQTVYRSPYIGDDVLKTSYTRGSEYNISIQAEFRF